MNIRFFENFSKRKNSTKIPGGDVSYHDTDCKLKEDTSTENPSIVLAGRFGTDTRTGNPVTTSNAMAGNAKALTVDMLPIQEGSGTPSPDNIRPISGRTSLDVTVNGETETINLGTTVYGGTCDVVGGETSSEWQNVNVESASQIRRNAPKQFYVYGVGGFEAGTSVVSDKFKTAVSGSGVCFINNSGAIRFNTVDEYETAEACYNAIGNIQFVAKSSSSTPINTPATTISLNKGNNTLSTSGDNMTVTYDTMLPSGELPFNYTYAYIGRFNKYYFLSNPIILTNNQIQYDLEEDCLASHKSEIGSTVAHIAYSSTGYGKYIPDTRMCVRSDKVYLNATSAASGLSSGGAYILSVINDKSNGLVGAATYYVMSTGDLARLTKNLLDASILTQIKNIFDNPMDSIVSCTWIPVSPADMTGHIGAGEFVHIGNAELDGGGDPSMACAGSPITSPILALSPVTLTIPYKWGDFRDAQPYTSFSLYLPGVGETDLNASDFIESDTVTVYPRVDLTTGDIIYWVYDNNGIVLKTVTFSGGCDVPLAHITTNAKGALATVGGSVGGLVTSALGMMTGNAPLSVGGGLALLGAAGSTAMQFNTRSTSIKGSTNGRSAFADVTFKLTVCSQETENIDSANYIARWGRPVAQTHAISNHSGYVQCESASVSIAGSDGEREAINNFLNTGFYYE